MFTTIIMMSNFYEQMKNHPWLIYMNLSFWKEPLWPLCIFFLRGSGQSQHVADAPLWSHSSCDGQRLWHFGYQSSSEDVNWSAFSSPELKTFFQNMSQWIFMVYQIKVTWLPVNILALCSFSPSYKCVYPSVPRKSKLPYCSFHWALFLSTMRMNIDLILVRR